MTEIHSSLVYLADYSVMTERQVSFIKQITI